MPTTATRSRPASAPIGTGALHQALENSSALSQLKLFCAAVACTPDEASSDGIHIDVLRVLDLMRHRSYQVSAPYKTPHQPNPGSTTWACAVILPGNGVSLRLAFVVPNAS